MSIFVCPPGEMEAGCGKKKQYNDVHDEESGYIKNGRIVMLSQNAQEH